MCLVGQYIPAHVPQYCLVPSSCMLEKVLTDVQVNSSLIFSSVSNAYIYERGIKEIYKHAFSFFAGGLISVVSEHKISTLPK